MRSVTQLLVEIPETAPVALGLSPERLGPELLLAAAIQWFASGKLSSGAAAALAGISKPEFMLRLKDFGEPAFRQSAEQLREEWANA